MTRAGRTMLERLAPSSGNGANAPRWVGRYWPVIAGGTIFAAPALLAVGRAVWTTEQGAHGPIILLTGLWLLMRDASGMPGEAARRWSRAGRAALAAVVVAGALLAVFCAVIGKVWLLAAATYAALAGVYARCAGPVITRRAGFALAYLGFLVPPPPGLIVWLTRSLKLALAHDAAAFVAALGYNATSLGASLYIDSYELVVAAACAGLNALTSLLAIALLYAWLARAAQPAALALLALAALPVAVLANFLRVVLLLLVTHYLGNAAAQGMLHDAAGLTTFALALAVMALLDRVLDAVPVLSGRLRPASRRPRGALAQPAGGAL